MKWNSTSTLSYSYSVAVKKGKTNQKIYRLKYCDAFRTFNVQLVLNLLNSQHFKLEPAVIELIFNLKLFNFVIVVDNF